MASVPSTTSSAFEDISRKIYLLRFPLIVLIVLIHARLPGPDDFPDNWSRFFVEEVLLGKVPHCAVCVFFLISGYLFKWTEQSNYVQFLLQKLKKLMIPFFLWNTLLMGAHLLVGLLPHYSILPEFKYAGMTPWQVIVRSYGLDLDAPIDIPLWYLPHLMALLMVAPLMLWIIRRLPIWLTPLLLLPGPFFMTQYSIFFFALGIYCRYWDFDLRPLSKWWPLFLLLPLGYFIYADFYGYYWPLLFWISLVFFLGIAMLLQKLPMRLQNYIVHCGKYSFWIFCTHAPVATTMGRVGLKLNCLGALYVLWLAFNCVFTLSVVVGGLWILRRFMPGFANLLCGTRFPKHFRSEP